MSEDKEGGIAGGTSELRRSSAAQMLNKRPRLLSFQGLSSHSRSLGDRDAAAPIAGTSSSSMEHINRREQLASDLRSWQETQIAACMEDNILNMVLERYLIFFEQRNNRNDPEQPQAGDEELLEDEAIRMAINERGLQAAGPDEAVASSSSASAPVPAAQSDSNSVGEAAGANWPHLGRALHDNFILETAVTAAIQEKGLVSGCAENVDATDSDDSAFQEDGAS